MVGFYSYWGGGRTAVVSRRCYTFVVFDIVLLQSGVAGIGLPEHASGGHVGQYRLGRHAQDVGLGNCTSRRCSADDGTGPATRQAEPEWGEIEQKCDHFTRASWTPGHKHMRHDMMREEGRRGLTAEGHANAFSCRMKQRYWMHTRTWDRPVGPVMLVVGGEASIDGGNIGGYILDAASELSALIVVVEHRFFGKSIPDGWNETNGLSLLTMQQAVEDLAVFRDKFQRQVLAPQGQSENVWITTGCGYAGALATWARMKYPGHFAGAWASSPPLLAAVEFPAHDMHDREAVGERCAHAIRGLVDTMDVALNNMAPEAAFRVKSLFDADDELSNKELILLVHESISLAIQFGLKHLLCDTLGKTNQDDIIPAFANLTTTLWGSSYGKSCHLSTACLSNVQQGLTPARAWHWIQCTQLGLFATSPRSDEELGIRHKALDVSFFMRRCVAVFGKGTRTDPHGPRSTFTGPSDNVLVVAEQDDPWKRAAFVQHHDASETIEIDCRGCGHCIDMLSPMYTDAQQLIVARAKILSHLRTWSGAKV